jgi:hypothetical protein
LKDTSKPSYLAFQQQQCLTRADTYKKPTSILRNGLEPLNVYQKSKSQRYLLTENEIYCTIRDEGGGLLSKQAVCGVGGPAFAETNPTRSLHSTSYIQTGTGHCEESTKKYRVLCP